jgi:hypothetical protein
MSTRTITFALAAGLALAATAQASPGRHGGEMRVVAKEAFAEADADKSGGLTADEFTRFHEAFRARMAARRFAALDTNDDGVVTAAELEAGRPHRHGRHRK